ncbi:P-loop NTPase [Thermogladius sp. 4427co]|uniref:P-loop NTPase n=1 Tax=Thermogladius sp. 4427co TaxID=3450718 RepID=UPI003F7AFBDB
MWRVSVTGGKGGTGKSFVAVNLAVLLSKRFKLVLADLDLEGPNDHVLLGLSGLGEGVPIKLFLPFINPANCTRCGVCVKVCDTGALLMPPKSLPIVFPRLCSGCKACYYACPYNAIREGYHVLGYIHVNNVKGEGYGFTLVTGVLREGEEHTPPGVYRVKKYAEELGPELLLIDTSAGTGNHVSIALERSDLVIVVTEPTPLGLHDMVSILEVVKGMGLKSWLVINKAGIGREEEHLEKAREYSVERVFRIPYSTDVVESYVSGTPIVVSKPGSTASRVLYEIAEGVAGLLGRGGL